MNAGKNQQRSGVVVSAAYLRISILLALGLSVGGHAQTQPSEKISDAEKVRRSSEALNKMRQTLKDVLSKLEEARKTKDVMKLNCVNDKLTSIKGLLRVSEQSDVALQEAMARNDSDHVDKEYVKVSIAAEKMVQLRAASEECIGQLAFEANEDSSVEVEVPDNLPSGDTTTNTTNTVLQAKSLPASPTL